MREISTVCARDCYDTCTLIVTLDETGQILRIKGDPSHPITQGFTCPRGAKDHERLFENRVRAPACRRGEGFEETDWESALDLVSEKLRETLDRYGPESVLYLDHAGNTGLLTGAFPTRLWNALGATQTDHSVCSASGHAALSLHYGDSYGLEPMDLLSRELIVFWGFNAAVSSPHLWALARRARRERGAQIVVIDPRESRSARNADVWVQSRPGSDVALAYGLVNHLIQKGHVDLRFVERWTEGFQPLAVAAREWSPARVEEATGVAWSRVEELGEAYASRRPGATMIGIGIQKNDRGADQVRAASFLPALLGQHRGFFYSNSHAFSVDADLISGRSLTRDPGRTVSLVALADLVDRGEFKFVYVTCMNPAQTLPHQGALREGLRRDDVFLAVHDTHWTRTAEYADVVLPAPTYLEKEDLIIPWTHPYVRYSRPVVDPVTYSRSEIWVMREVARRLSLTEGWLFEDPWAAVEAALEGAFGEGCFDELRAGATLRLRGKPLDRYPTPSGKIEFYSTQAAVRRLDPLPGQAPRACDGGFVVLTSATPKYTSTQFQEIYGPIPAEVVVNARDAQRLGIDDGAVVTLSNGRGEVRMKAIVSDTVMEGTVWSPRQSEGLAGQPQNCLFSSEPQEIGGGSRFNSTTVTISRLQSGGVDSQESSTSGCIPSSDGGSPSASRQ